MSVPLPTRAMMDAIDPAARNEWTLWLNRLVAAIKDLEDRVSSLEDS